MVGIAHPHAFSGRNRPAGNGDVPLAFSDPAVCYASAVIDYRHSRHPCNRRDCRCRTERFREEIQVDHRRRSFGADHVFWDIGLNWLNYKFKILERLLAPAPLPLIENGKMNRRNMRSQLITAEELRGQLRQQGVSDLTEVSRACLEENGEISVVKKEDDEVSKKRKKPV